MHSKKDNKKKWPADLISLTLDCLWHSRSSNRAFLAVCDFTSGPLTPPIFPLPVPVTSFSCHSQPAPALLLLPLLVKKRTQRSNLRGEATAILRCGSHPGCGSMIFAGQPPVFLHLRLLFSLPPPTVFFPHFYLLSRRKSGAGSMQA